MERKLKTQKGSVIKRSPKYGVGKYIGGTIYVHRQYEDVIPNISDIKKALKKDIGDFKYNVVAYDGAGSKARFIEAKDFDTADEPTVGNYIIYDFKNGVTKHGTTDTIYHHKWLFVKDDYKGFNVQQSYDRSARWLAIPDINFSKIGHKKYWKEITKGLK